MTGRMLIGETQAPKWTAEEDQVLVRLIGEGNSATLIAKELARSRSSVCGRAHRLKIHFSSSRRSVVKRAQPAKIVRVRFSPAEDKIIIDMAADGKCGREISEIIKRSKSSVVKRARLLGAKLTNKPGPDPKPKAPKVKVVKQHLHAGNIASKRESRTRDPGFSHVTLILDVEPLMVALVDLGPNMCRFPCGDPREEGFGFCGHPKEDGAYCRHHAAIAYTPPELRRRAVA